MIDETGLMIMDHHHTKLHHWPPVFLEFPLQSQRSR